jgi:hypothetical protein
MTKDPIRLVAAGGGQEAAAKMKWLDLLRDLRNR